MSDLDKKIREALRQEDSDLFAEFEQEPTLFEMSMQMFRQRSRWLIALIMLWTLVLMVFSVYAVVRFLAAESQHDMLLWSGVCLLSMGAFALIKIWSWMEINKNFVTREIKRVELQIARLAARMGSDKNDGRPTE